MGNWSYSREEQTFKPLEVGDYRIRVKSAEKAVSKNGSDMLTLQFDVSGSKATLYHYIVFLPDKPEITNRNLTAFFDSFKDIKEGDFKLANWIGKVGACHVKHEEYNGNPQAKIQYFIKADKQDVLPAWKEPESDSSTSQTDANGFMNIPDGVDEELPF